MQLSNVPYSGLFLWAEIFVKSRSLEVIFVVLNFMAIRSCMRMT